MIKINEKLLKDSRLSFTFISLCVLLRITAIAAVANAQTDPSTPATDIELPAAQEATGSTSRESSDATRGALETERALNRQAIQDTRANIRANLNAIAQTRIENLAANISNRLDAYVARLEQILTRFESRVVMLQLEGKNTTLSTEKLTEARGHLNEAKLKLVSIDANVAEVIGGTTIRSSWQNLKSQYEAIRGDIKAAHEDMRSALTQLKEEIANPTPTETATSTEDVTEE